MIAAISDDALIAVNSLEILGIIYLAIAVSKLRSEITYLQGKLSQREHDEETGRKS